MAKQVKKTTTKKNLYFSIYLYIKDNKKLPKHTMLGISKQNLNYYTTALKNAEIVKRIGYGVWQIIEDLTEKEVQKRSKNFKVVTTTFTAKKISQNYRYLRYHSLQFRINLPKFEHWHRRNIFLDKKQIPYKTLTGNKHRIQHKGVIFHLCSNCILFYCPENINIYGLDTDSVYKRAIAWAKQQVISISNLLSIDITIQGKWSLELTRGEIEETNNELAKEYQDQNKPLQIYENEELWLIADKSLKSNNLEFKSSKNHLPDAEKIIPFFNDLRNHPSTISEERIRTENYIKELHQQIQTITLIMKEQQKAVKLLLEERHQSINMDRFKY